MRYFCAMLLLLQLARPALADDPQIKFVVRGNVITSQTAHTLDFLVAHRKLTVTSPKSHAVLTVRGVPLSGALTAIFGRTPEPGEVVRIKSKDNYVVEIPMWMMNEHEGYLAYSLADGRPLPARLAPFWLVWKDAPDSDKHGKLGRFWPRQIVSIELGTPGASHPHVHGHPDGVKM